jgi:predicted NBD/HSP70 family sugar kinase/biotin operon repressor
VKIPRSIVAPEAGQEMVMEWSTGGSQPLKAADPARGTNQAGVRAYNERLLLSLIRQNGSLPKAEIARLTGLSAQTISVIVRALEEEGYLVREKPQRGKVGQPLIPFSLNPAGAYFLGLKIGRRSGDLLLIDLAGRVISKIHQTYRYPSPADFLAFVEKGIADVTAPLGAKGAKRIAGLGIAAPFELWNWEDAVGAPKNVMAAWRGFDMKAEIERFCDWPVHFCNDATAACAGELVFGNGEAYPDFVYFFVSYFIGGGIVLNGSLVPGRTGNAGALGSMPVAAPKGGTQQLIRSASLYVLERMLREEGRDPSVLWRSPNDWGDIGHSLDRWIEEAALSLAQAVAAAASVADFSAAIIDGAFPDAVRQRLAAKVEDKLSLIDTRGISPITIIQGSIGSDARAMGGASLPLLANFAVDRNVLFKEGQ